RTQNRSDPAAAVDAVEEFRRVWQSSQRLGEVSALRYGLPGRERAGYGRARRVAVDDEATREAIPLGRLAGLATFQLSDPRSFADAVSSVTLNLVPESTGGIIFPLTFPMTTTVTGGVRAGFVSNEG